MIVMAAVEVTPQSRLVNNNRIGIIYTSLSIVQTSLTAIIIYDCL